MNSTEVVQDYGNIDPNSIKIEDDVKYRINHISNTSFTRVVKDGNVWKAIGLRPVDQKRIRIGIYESKEEALAAVTAFENGEVVVRSKLMQPRRAVSAASGVKGVRFKGTKWEARGSRPGVKDHYLGVYATKEEAGEAVAAYERGEEVIRPKRPPSKKSEGQRRKYTRRTPDRLDISTNNGYNQGDEKRVNSILEKHVQPNHIASDADALLLLSAFASNKVNTH